MSSKKINIAYTESRSFKVYVDEAGEYTPMTRQQEFDCFERIKAGDLEARHEIVLANQRFIIKIAGYYKGLGVCYEDLVQAGNIGMIQSIDGFDHTIGNKFISYAVWRVRMNMQREIMSLGKSVKLLENHFQYFKQLREAENRLAATGVRTITADDLYEATGIPMGHCLTHILSGGADKRLDWAVDQGNDNGMTYLDRLADDRSIDDEINATLDRDLVDRILADLDGRRREVIFQCYGLDGNGKRTLSDIGKDFGLSRERVRQMKEEALATIRSKKKFAYVMEAIA